MVLVVACFDACYRFDARRDLADLEASAISVVPKASVGGC